MISDMDLYRCPLNSTGSMANAGGGKTAAQHEQPVRDREDYDLSIKMVSCEMARQHGEAILIKYSKAFELLKDK